MDEPPEDALAVLRDAIEHQFWWFFGSGLALGALFVLSRRLIPGVIIHWIIILSAMLGIFTAIQAS